MTQRNPKAAGLAALLGAVLALTATGAAAAAPEETGAQPAAAVPWTDIGRAATADELAAWDIDVRGDFTGLPPGSGSVERGMEVWDEKCASCHGTFGESNEVFTPIVGGTSAQDIETGRVAALARPDFPQRTTLMKLSRISTLWDYINRAMPWTTPKSLSVEEVYAVTAYILNLGDIVAADFVLSDKNIAEVQKLLPNRDGMRFFEPLWVVDGVPDVQGDDCMRDCYVQSAPSSVLPAFARDAHGNLAAQNRVVGPVRGADTTAPALGSADRAEEVRRAARATVVAAGEGGHASAGLAVAANCMSCHSRDRPMVGPSFRAVAERYHGEPQAAEFLAARIRQGTRGAWGPLPMPPNAAVSDDELRQIVDWILAGAP